MSLLVKSFFVIGIIYICIAGFGALVTCFGGRIFQKDAKVGSIRKWNPGVSGLGVCLFSYGLVLAFGFYSKRGFEVETLAQQFNLRKGIMLDSNTRLDEAVVGDEKRLVMNLTLVDTRAVEFNILYWRNSFQPKVIDLVRRSPEFAKLLDSGGLVEMRYHSKDNAVIEVLDIGKDRIQSSR
jgi:hypothetical protein